MSGGGSGPTTISPIELQSHVGDPASRAVHVHSNGGREAVEATWPTIAQGSLGVAYSPADDAVVPASGRCAELSLPEDEPLLLLSALVEDVEHAATAIEPAVTPTASARTNRMTCV